MDNPTPEQRYQSRLTDLSRPAPDFRGMEGLPDLTSFGPDLTQGLLDQSQLLPGSKPSGFADEFKPKLAPHQRSLLESWAEHENSREDLTEYITAAQKGVRPEEVDKVRTESKAMELAQNTANLSDQQYNELVERIRREINTPVKPPEVPQLEGPNLAQAAVAAFGALTNPRYAYDIGSTPFQAQLLKQQQDYQKNVQQAEFDQDARRERLQFLGTQMQIAERRRDDAYQRVAQLADEARKAGDTQTANGLKARADLFTSKSKAELVDKVRTIREVYGEEFLPPEQTLTALWNDLDSEEKAKAEELRLKGEAGKRDAAKDEETRINTLVDNFRSTYPPSDFYKKEDIDQVNQRWKAYAKANKLPLDRMPAYIPHTPVGQQNADFARERYNNDAEMRQMLKEMRQIQLDQAKLNLQQDKERPSPETASKREQLDWLEKKLRDAKFDTNTLRGMTPPKDEEEKAKFDAKVQEAWAKEVAIVQEKRRVADGKVPTALEYFKERFPSSVETIGSVFPKLFGPIVPEGSGIPKATSKEASETARKISGKKAKGKSGNTPLTPPISGFGPGK